MKTLWKVFKKDLKSEHGNTNWVIGEWNKVKDQVVLCENGFHASNRIIDAMQYTNAEEIALVEVRGTSDIVFDKEAWEEMKILKVYKWSKEMSVKLAIFAAELCIDNFERVYPNDDRPRKAIQAAKDYLEGKIDKLAARSVAKSTARSVAKSTARSVAWSAAKSAEAAARSVAESATRSAEWSAHSAAWSAWLVAGDSNIILNKCEEYVKQLIGAEE